jgi:type VI secretion system secreted protein VgrG
MPEIKSKQHERLLTVQVASLGSDDLLVTGLMGHEEVSALFSFKLNLISDVPEKIVLNNIVGKNVTIGLMLRDESYRHFNGFVSRFSAGGRDYGGDQRFTHYRAEVVPWLWFLSRTADCRIFQEKTVPEIIEQIFKDLGFQDFRFDLNRSYTKWDYCVQYRETDFHFVSRLMEQEGIFYFFEHENGKHTLVMADATSAYNPCPNQTKARFFREGGFADREDTVNAWEVDQEFRPGKYTLRDYHFQMPSKNLEVAEPTKFNVGGNSKFEVYDFPGEYAQRFNKPDERLGKVEPEGRTVVGLRMEEEETPHLVHYGASICRAFTAGKRFELIEPPHSVSSGPYVLTSVQHSATQPAEFVSGGDGSASDASYTNTFTCIPADVVFRPSRITPRSIVQGPQTAVVVGPKGEEIYTDKYGRVKVQFHWDREGKKDENSSCWVRVAQIWAGKRWGASFWPRIGQEVVVDFLEGDPDQPIIVGSVYNAEQMPPYQGDGPDSKHKSDNKVTGFKTNSTKGGRGFNELRFDDTKDKEQIFIHAERNMDIRVKKDRMESVGGSRHLTVGGEKREKVGGNKHVHVSGELLHWVEKDDHHIIGGDLVEEFQKNHAQVVSAEYWLKANRVIIEAESEICLMVGGNFVRINASGVAIEGTLVNINCGNVPSSGAPASGLQSKGPEDPAAADNAVSGSKSAPS